MFVCTLFWPPSTSPEEGAGGGRQEGGRGKGGKEKETLSTYNTEQSSYRAMKPKVTALGAPSQALYLAEYIVFVL